MRFNGAKEHALLARRKQSCSHPYHDYHVAVTTGPCTSRRRSLPPDGRSLYLDIPPMHALRNVDAGGGSIQSRLTRAGPS